MARAIRPSHAFDKLFNDNDPILLPRTPMLRKRATVRAQVVCAQAQAHASVHALVAPSPPRPPGAVVVQQSPSPAPTRTQRRRSRASPNLLAVVHTTATKRKKKKNKGGRASRNLHAGVPPLPALAPPHPDLTDAGFLANVRSWTADDAAAQVRMAARVAEMVASRRLENLQHPIVTTITFHIYLRLGDHGVKYVDQHMLAEMLEADSVRAYNARTIERQPVLEPTDFNGGAILSLHQDKEAGHNSIGLKIFGNMSMHITGPKTLGKFLSIAEYSRGLVQELKGGEEVRLESFATDLINTTFELGRPVNLQALASYLQADAQAGGGSRPCAHAVTHQTNLHAGVIYKLFDRSVESTRWPTVIVFARGCVLIGAKGLDLIAEAFEHVTEAVFQVHL